MDAPLFFDTVSFVTLRVLRVGRAVWPDRTGLTSQYVLFLQLAEIAKVAKLRFKNVTVDSKGGSIHMHMGGELLSDLETKRAAVSGRDKRHAAETCCHQQPAFRLPQKAEHLFL